MSAVKIVVSGVKTIQPGKHGELIITVEMREAQMLDALLSFLEHVPGPKWEDWKAIIDDE